MPVSSKIKSFLRTCGQTEQLKGLSAEEKALKVIILNCAKEPWILFPRKATIEEDIIKGIDIVVETDIGKLYLQIKSSESGRRRYCEKRRRIMVEVVVVRPHDDADTVWDNIRKALINLRVAILEQRGNAVLAELEPS